MSYFIGAIIVWSIAVGLIWAFVIGFAKQNRQWDRDNRVMLERMRVEAEIRKLKAFGGADNQTSDPDKQREYHKELLRFSPCSVISRKSLAD